MNKEVNVLSNKSMSSLEIAELTGKRHDNVIRDTRKILDELGIDALKFEATYLTVSGDERIYFNLPRLECDLVVSGYSAKYRMAIIKRWHELEKSNAVALPQTFSDALRLAADLHESLNVAILQIEQDKPKVEFAMAVRNAVDSCSVEEFSKTVGIGKNKYYKLLRDDGYLMKNNLPYQVHLDSKLFIVEEKMPWTDSKGETYFNFATRITGKGQVTLEKKYRGILSAAA